jgi:26S proteasome regulatory subunit T5
VLVACASSADGRCDLPQCHRRRLTVLAAGVCARAAVHLDPVLTTAFNLQADLESADIWGEGDETSEMDKEILTMTNEEVRQRVKLLDNDIRIMRSEVQRITHDTQTQRDRIKENNEKIKLNKQLPYLVGNIVEILELELEDDEDGGSADVDAQRKGKSAVIKTSTRQTIFLPIPGLVDTDKMEPGDLVGTNKDSYLILEKLPCEYDSRVKAMEVDEKPTEDYSDIGGLDKQIQELVEAVVLPMTHKEKFEAVGIRPPKGVLLHGPPGTGKTLLARACAKQTDAVFLKLAGPQLVQMFIGDGAKLVRDAFELAKEKCEEGNRAGAIIFIDELDAIGTKRFGGEQSGDREVQRTMLELLSQLDGFTSNTKIKVIAATNRPDVLDPALLRSGRLDRKIELPHPSEDARGKIMQIHSRKMNVDVEDVNFEELARCTDDFNAAQLKAVCVEAGMLALRREGTEIKVHVLLFDSPSRTRLTLHFLSAYRSTKILWRVFPRCKPRRRGVSTTMLKCQVATRNCTTWSHTRIVRCRGEAG